MFKAYAGVALERVRRRGAIQAALAELHTHDVQVLAADLIDLAALRRAYLPAAWH